jgi:V8-like Glu-specific endopeptidase
MLRMLSPSHATTLKGISKVRNKPKLFWTTTATVSLLLSAPLPGLANENVVGRPQQDDTSISAAQLDAAEVIPNRILTSPTDLSPKIRSILGLPDSDIAGEAFGDGNHPFSTAAASSEGSITPVDHFPWSATGKMFMAFGNQTFVCTASVIGRSLLVTAAHCVHEFGQGQNGFADAVAFEPARHGSEQPFGTWTAKEWWIPKVYFDGTDVCSAEAPGVVCENDVAVVVLDENEGSAIEDVVGGKYKVAPDDDFGYVFFLGQNSANFTQLGYPKKDFGDGLKMIRTDSLGYQDDPSNVIIGSNQTGGSSGGPWLQNFGTLTPFTGTAPTDADPNTVTSVTSWGFTSGVVKVQGGSRFAHNHTYTLKSNIHSLVDEACSNNPTAC